MNSQVIGGVLHFAGKEYDLSRYTELRYFQDEKGGQHCFFLNQNARLDDVPVDGVGQFRALERMCISWWDEQKYAAMRPPLPPVEEGNEEAEAVAAPAAKPAGKKSAKKEGEN